MKILRKLRNEKGLTQSEVAKFLGVGRTTYTQYETGKSEPDVKTLKKLAIFFNVTVDYLINDGKMQNEPKEQNEILKEIETLSEESKKELEKYIQLLKIKEQVEKTKEEQSSALEKEA
ncbi:helix-turn-helix domain-containing protein [Caloranaerobacter azorensis]|uniref:Helix-turn-helix transcriptional regulator n=1 Tax=Caloranaerobacter azorensis TaxID=116090 RepID=A0A6P1YB02_9FIRM|nr:helix-turn-helix transcriptional regulator [Caloranaerobacter azorensis]QIB26062.1 helix-turn-helix transcriptional regulator [Caloranaerobacter azorensis]